MARRRFGVLVVDDEPDLRELIRLLLEFEESLEVIELAAGAEQAIEAATVRSDEIDLVVLDQYLRGPISGLEVARHVRITCPRAKVLLFTADDRPRPDAAVDAVVWKPDLEHLPEVALGLVRP